MSYLNDPIILIFLLLFMLFSILALNRGQRMNTWLVVMTLLLFCLPRAGIVISQLGLPLPLAHILVVFCIIEWLLLRQQRHHEKSPINVIFMIYAAMVGMGLAIGLSTGGNPLIAFLELCFYLFAIGLFFYVSETFYEQHHFLRFIPCILVASLVISVYGIAQHFLGDSILIDYLTYNSGSELARSYIHSSEIFRRVLSSYGDPNVLANQLVVFYGIALALFIGKAVPLPFRFGALILLILNVICIYYTGSRAGMVCLVLIPMLLLCWRTRWAFMALPFLFGAAVLFGPLLYSHFITEKFSGLVSTDDIRMHFPRMAWELLRAVPFGCGLGNAIFLHSEGTSLAFLISPTSTLWGGFNSFWLNLFSRLGVPGLVAFLLLTTMLYRYLYQQIKRVDVPHVKAFLIGGLAGSIGYALIWVVNNTYILPGGGLNYWFMMGMMVAGARAFAVQPYPAMLPPQTNSWLTEQAIPT